MLLNLILIFSAILGAVYLLFSNNTLRTSLSDAEAKLALRELLSEKEISLLKAEVYAYEQSSWHLGYQLTEALNRGDISEPILKSDAYALELLGLYKKENSRWYNETYSHFVRRKIEGKGLTADDVEKYDLNGDSIPWHIEENS
jgi:hypothetical protein